MLIRLQASINYADAGIIRILRYSLISQSARLSIQPEFGKILVHLFVIDPGIANIPSVSFRGCFAQLSAAVLVQPRDTAFLATRQPDKRT